jgi:hypothetical protein
MAAQSPPIKHPSAVHEAMLIGNASGQSQPNELQPVVRQSWPLATNTNRAHPVVAPADPPEFRAPPVPDRPPRPPLPVARAPAPAAPSEPASAAVRTPVSSDEHAAMSASAEPIPARWIVFTIHHLIAKPTTIADKRFAPDTTRESRNRRFRSEGDMLPPNRCKSPCRTLRVKCTSRPSTASTPANRSIPRAPNTALSSGRLDRARRAVPICRHSRKQALRGSPISRTAPCFFYHIAPMIAGCAL